MYNLEQKNKFSVGEEIEVIRPGSEALNVTVLSITDEEGNDMDSCPHPKQMIYIDLGIILYPYDILRRKELD
jgi:putative protease